jgi:hypothetical protein
MAELLNEILTAVQFIVPENKNIGKLFCNRLGAKAEAANISPAIIDAIAIVIGGSVLSISAYNRWKSRKNDVSRSGGQRENKPIERDNSSTGWTYPNSTI